MLMWLVGSSLAQAAEQSLVYDLTLAGEPVGHRTVTIKYATAKDRDSGSREVESFTEINMTIAGKEIAYQQHATGVFTDSKTRFVSIVSLNGTNFELQGKSRSNQSWIVHEILPSGVLKHEYSAYEVQGISLALFDPGQSNQWTEGHQSFYQIETGDVWSGEWHSEKESSISNNGESILGRQSRYHSDKGDLVAAWSSEGLLLDWELKIMGVTLDATLRNLPAKPDFGEVNIQQSFQGVEEESL
jgi:hypothetical protein